MQQASRSLKAVEVVTQSVGCGAGLYRCGGAALWLGLLLLGLWEVLGADLWLIRLFGSPAGFALREHRLFSQVLHDGGRLLAWVAIALLAWDAWALRWSGPSRRLRWVAVALVLLTTVLISVFKRVSKTSCPWDTLEFGGAWPYVPHWLLQVHDGGPGHCFPSGHASAAFAFLLAWAIWRLFNPVIARRMLAMVLVLGSLFAGVQMVRGAHYLSHSLWTAWLCWAMAWLVGQAMGRVTGRVQPNCGACGLATGKPAATQAS
jgi:membrane-associated PAP2 superfamily phosphatase